MRRIHAGPSIKSVHPLDVSMLGNTSITVRGDNLGGPFHMPYVTVGNMPCLEVKSISDQEVICSTPSGAFGSHPIEVSVDGRANEPIKCFETPKRCVAYHCACKCRRDVCRGDV